MKDSSSLIVGFTGSVPELVVDEGGFVEGFPMFAVVVAGVGFCERLLTVNAIMVTQSVSARSIATAIAIPLLSFCFF